MKMILNHLQVAALASNFPLNWPPALVALFSYFASFSSVPDKVSALECEAVYLAPDVPYIYLKNVVFAIMPVVLVSSW